MLDLPPTYDEVCSGDTAAGEVTDTELPSYRDYVRSLPHVVVVVDITASQQLGLTPSALSPARLSASSASSPAAAAAGTPVSEQQDPVTNAEESQQTE